MGRYIFTRLGGGSGRTLTLDDIRSLQYILARAHGECNLSPEHLESLLSWLRVLNDVSVGDYEDPDQALADQGKGGVTSFLKDNGYWRVMTWGTWGHLVIVDNVTEAEAESAADQVRKAKRIAKGTESN